MLMITRVVWCGVLWMVTETEQTPDKQRLTWRGDSVMALGQGQGISNLTTSREAAACLPACCLLTSFQLEKI